MQGARPTPTCSVSLSLPFASLPVSLLRSPRPSVVELAPRSTHPLRTNSKPPPGTVASPFASYLLARNRAYTCAPGISNFTRESNNKCWTFAASQVYRCYRRFTWIHNEKKDKRWTYRAMKRWWLQFPCSPL